MIRWESPSPAASAASAIAPDMTGDARARKCEFLARRLDRSGEAHSAEVARMLARSHRCAAQVSS